MDIDVFFLVCPWSFLRRYYPNDGKVLTSNHLNEEIKIYHRLQYVYLNRYFLTPERLNYLNFHRENIFKRGFATYSSS